MKDVILITTCISVTDAYYYDIRNDFNCSEKCFFVSFFAAAPRAKCCKHFYSFIKTRSEARRWMERHFMMRENEKFSNLFKSLRDYDSQVGLITCFAFHFFPPFCSSQSRINVSVSSRCFCLNASLNGFRHSRAEKISCQL